MTVGAPQTAWMVLVGLSFFGYFLFLTRRLGVHAPTAPLVAIAVVIATQFGLGIVGQLRFGAYLALALGLAAGAYDVLKSRLAIRPHFSIGDGAWLAAGAAAAIMFYRSIPADFMFIAWDEFSHWAVSPLEIYRTDALYQASSIVSFKHYPPATSLFQVYLARFVGYSEKWVLFANILLVIAGLMAAVGGLSRHRKLAGVLLFVLALNLISHFKHGYGYYHVLVDALLGGVFGAAMVAAIAAPGRLGGLVTVCALVILLVLVKQIGLVLALMVSCTVAAGVALRFYRLQKDGSATAPSMRLAVRDVALPFVACVLTYLSWSWYVSGIGPLRKVAVSAGSLFEEPRLVVTVGTVVEFITRVSAPRFFAMEVPPVSLSVLGLFVALLAASALAIVCARREDRVNYAVAFSATALGCVAYLLFLLYSYLNFFIDYEALRVVSLERYVETYFIGWSLVLLGVAAAWLDGLRWHVLRYTVMAGLLYCFYWYPMAVMTVLTAGPTLPPEKVADRRHELRLATQLLRVASKGDHVLYVRQNSSGYEALVFQYLISPLRRSDACYSYGRRYSADDIWTCDKPLLEEIKGERYIVISLADAQFWERNGALFDPQDRGAKDGVFAVERAGESVRLHRVP